MSTKTINAASNPGLANQLVQQALADSTPEAEPVIIKAPLDVIVDLPGGYITPEGEVHRTAEVRELNGMDEEAISKASNMTKAMVVLLNRATVKIGSVPATEAVLSKLLMADRDAILLGIYRATFGNTAEIGSYCNGCRDTKTVSIDVIEDIPIKRLDDPIEDRAFTIKGRVYSYLVKLPEIEAQRELANSLDRTSAEIDTLLLEHCVMQINGRPVLGKQQIQAIGIADRRAILKEILARNPGPQFEQATVPCPDCGGEVVVPINLGTLFRL